MKTLINSILLIVFLGVTGVSNAETTPAKEPAAQTAKITGKVTDHQTGEELAGVLVTVEGTNEKVYTDLEGNFNINSLQPGSYNLVLSMLSYKTSLVEDFRVNAGKEEVLEIKLNNQ